MNRETGGEAATMAHTNAHTAAMAVDPAAGEPGCRELELLLAEYRREQLPAAARRHLEQCAECTAMVEDFERIADQVRALPALDPEPVPDQWPQIREALRREGIIHAPENCDASRPAPQLVPNPRSGTEAPR